MNEFYTTFGMIPPWTIYVDLEDYRSRLKLSGSTCCMVADALTAMKPDHPGYGLADSNIVIRARQTAPVQLLAEFFRDQDQFEETVKLIRLRMLVARESDVIAAAQTIRSYVELRAQVRGELGDKFQELYQENRPQFLPEIGEDGRLLSSNG